MHAKIYRIPWSGFGEKQSKKSLRPLFSIKKVFAPFFSRKKASPPYIFPKNFLASLAFQNSLTQSLENHLMFLLYDHTPMNTPDRYAKMVLSSNASLPGSCEVFCTAAAVSSAIVYASDGSPNYTFFFRKKSLPPSPVDGPGPGTQ